MDNNLSNLRVNSQRLEDDFFAISKIGSTDDGGVNRPALSEAHLAARTWFKERIIDAGLEFRVDSAGNHSAFLESGPNDAKTLLLGSHLDSVPNGGRFDGALGVVAALEVLRVMKETEVSLPVHLEAIDFTDEEGSLVDLLGSSALAGKLTRNDLENPRGGREEFLTGLARAGLKEDELFKARRDPELLAGFLEMHIEQGKRLIDAGDQIGVVSNIVGDCSYYFIYHGRADLSGPTPMQDRLDASIGASAFTVAVPQLVMNEFPDCVANVSDIKFLPGEIDIVPAQAVVSLEFRAPDQQKFERLEAALIEQGRSEAEKYGLGFETKFLGKHPPMSLSPEVNKAITQAAQTLGLNYTPIGSMAGHDGQSLADICPVGMIFVPSVQGISHSPQEFSHWNDCVNGTNVLLQTVFQFCDQLLMKDST